MKTEKRPIKITNAEKVKWVYKLNFLKFKIVILILFFWQSFSEKIIIQDNITETLKEEKYDESNEKKREKRQRDDNIDRVKDSYVSL